MLKFKIIVGILALIYVLGLLGLPQYLMRGPLREMTERNQAEIKRQCEAVNCWQVHQQWSKRLAGDLLQLCGVSYAEVGGG